MMKAQPADRTKLISDAVASYPRPTPEEVREAREANKKTRRAARQRFEERRKATRRYIREHPECIEMPTMSNQQLISAIALKLPSNGFAERFEQLYHQSRQRLIEEYRKYYGQEVPNQTD